MASQNTNRGVISNDLALPFLINLFNNGRQGTAQDAGTNSVYMRRMYDQALLREVGPVHTGRPGRPSISYRLTDMAAKRVKRALGK